MAPSVYGGGKLRSQGLAREIASAARIGPVAGDEITCPIVGYPDLAQLRRPQGGAPASANDLLRSPHPYARHAQQQLVGSGVHLERKHVEMVDCPIRLGIEVEVEIRMFLVDDFRNVEPVEPQQPIGLIQPVLPVELHGVGLGQTYVVVHRQIGAEEHPLHRQALVQRRRKAEDVVVGFGRSPHDELRRLPGRGERLVAVRTLYSPAVERHALTREQLGLLMLGDAFGDLAHGPQDMLAAFLGREHAEAFLRWQLQIHRKPVDQAPHAVYEVRARAGHRLRVNVAAETVFFPQDLECANHELGRVIGRVEHPRAEKQALDVIAPVELYGEIG